MTQSTSTTRDDRPHAEGRRRDQPARLASRTPEPEAVGSDRPSRATAARRLSIASAVLILAGGYVHFCLYRHGYQFIPKIGVSFLLQAGSSTALAAALLVLGGRRRVGQHSVALAQFTRLSAIGLSLGTLGALGLTHTPRGLFQFHEIGLRPAPQTIIAILVESLAALLLGVAMLEGRAASRHQIVTTAVATPAGHATRHAA